MTINKAVTPARAKRHIATNKWLYVGIVILLFYLIYPFLLARLASNPFRYSNNYFEIVTPVEQGGTAEYYAEICLEGKEEVTYTTSRFIHDARTHEKVVSLPALVVTVEPGCFSRNVRQVLIPRTIPPGEYYIRGTAVVPQRFRTWNIPWRTLPFTIEPSTGVQKNPLPQ